jgi:hypothetical protein
MIGRIHEATDRGGGQHLEAIWQQPPASQELVRVAEKTAVTVHNITWAAARIEEFVLVATKLEKRSNITTPASTLWSIPSPFWTADAADADRTKTTSSRAGHQYFMTLPPFAPDQLLCVQGFSWR